MKGREVGPLWLIIRDEGRVYVASQVGGTVHGKAPPSLCSHHGHHHAHHAHHANKLDHLKHLHHHSSCYLLLLSFSLFVFLFLLFLLSLSLFFWIETFCFFF